MGFHRLQSDANVYVWFEKCIYLLAYVDDLLIIGPLEFIKDFVIELGKRLLIKCTGNLDQEGSRVRFLGRILIRRGDSIVLEIDPDYFQPDLEHYGLSKCKPSNTPGSNELKRVANGDEPLDAQAHRRFRQAVGKLQWIAQLRVDLMYAIKELARALHAPCFEDLAKLKHLLRYIKGTLHYRFVLRVTILTPLDSFIELEVFVDSDWAGCSKTRRSTSGFVIYLFGCPAHFGSKTQAVPALSSGEAELYSIGTGSNEALHLRSFLIEARITKLVKIKVHTDSTTGKSIACRMGLQKRTRHVQLRFLFMQHLVSNNIVSIHKVAGDQNQADVLTKYVKAEVLQRHLEKIGIEYRVEYFNISNINYYHYDINMTNTIYHIENAMNNIAIDYHYDYHIERAQYYIMDIKYMLMCVYAIVSILLAQFVKWFQLQHRLSVRSDRSIADQVLPPSSLLQAMSNAMSSDTPPRFEEQSTFAHGAASSMTHQKLNSQDVDWVKLSEIDDEIKTLNQSLGIELRFGSVDDSMNLAPIKYDLKAEDPRFEEKTAILHRLFELVDQRSRINGMCIKTIEANKPIEAISSRSQQQDEKPSRPTGRKSRPLAYAASMWMKNHRSQQADRRGQLITQPAAG